MSRMDVGDREIGKGRHNDSSSSPESSPRQTKKRSFSPTSDDGDLVIPPIADDDTPPPPERPLIRQAVAFAWPGTTTTVAVPPSLNTYEMVKPSTTVSFKETLFLPGQYPEGAPPSASSQRKKKQTAGPSRKKKKANDYGGQTNRFRLDTHVSAVPSEPTMPQSPSSTMTLRANSGTPTASASPPVPSIVSSYAGENNIPTALQSPPVKAILPPTQQALGWNIIDPSSAAGPSRRPIVGNRRHAVVATEERDRGSSHYRRDYEKDLTIRQPEAQRSSAYHTSGSSSGQASNMYEMNQSSSRTSGQSSLPTTNRHAEERVKGALTWLSDNIEVLLNIVVDGRRTQKTPLLMLTLLIQDIRSGVTDHQLAEVKVPMKVANDPRDGFWADAKILGQQLQSSASRIDGPAKVYTLRGKYRQFFLRVSAENRDEFISTHLAIKPDRMLDVVVEELLPPGQLPQPPRIPRDLIARSASPSSSSGSPSPERDLYPLPSQRERYYGPSTNQMEHSNLYHKESSHRSLSPLSPNRDPSARGSKSQPGKTHTQLPGRSRSPSVESLSSDLLPKNPSFQSPVLGDPPEEVQRQIVTAVDTIIQEDEKWFDFFRFKGSAEPHRAMDVLEQYHIVKHMLGKFAGKKLPFHSFKAKIEPVNCWTESHITQALKIDDPNFASVCLETLDLLDLYGENGRHYADPRVIEIVKDSRTPEYNAKPIKRLLHLMRDIDKKWKEEHAPVPSSSEKRHTARVP
ncbi:hypothetical protein H0H87_000698 [Tephrocybe sp. NHM501043]|nr:hypothetical protein H0H87_000698 [Tephrocybe sp. NHM501043]